MAYLALPSIIRRYVDLHLPCETDPLALGVATLAAVSTALGRQAWADYCGRTHPMLWLAAVGATGLARKEQIARAAERMLAALLTNVAVLRDVSSGEALLEELGETPHAFLLLRELSLLTDRARSRETRLIGTKLLELYDLPEQCELRRVARDQKDDGRVIVSKPTLGVVATGTPSDLMPVDDLARRGLTNRLLVLPLREQPPVPRPVMPSDTAVQGIGAEIRSCLHVALQQGAYPFSRRAAKWWDEGDGLYVKLRREIRDLSEVERACIERRERHVVVLATLSAILDGHREIGFQDLKRASLIVREANERLLGLLRSVASDDSPDVTARRAVTAWEYVSLADAIRGAARPLSQVVLAERLKLPRVTVQRRLSDLESANLLRRTRDGYVAVGGPQGFGKTQSGQVGSGQPPAGCRETPAPPANAQKEAAR